MYYKQTNKSASEGKSDEQIVKDSFEAIYDNCIQIIGATPITKTAGITANHGLGTTVEKMFGGTQTIDTTLRSTGGKVIPYMFVSLAWGNTIVSALSDDPVARAYERGYSLK